MTSYKLWQFVKVLTGGTNLNSNMFLKAICWVRELGIYSMTFLTNSHVPSNAICSIYAVIETTKKVDFKGFM